jgi:FG-GAP repeat protein
MRRIALVVGCCWLVVAAVAVSPAFAQPTASSPSDVAGDFNRDGFADLAIGVPGEAIGGPRTRSPGRSTCCTELGVG